jgi:hypothetical protein
MDARLHGVIVPERPESALAGTGGGDTSGMKCTVAAASLALTAVLLAGCGGGGRDDQARVEAGLQNYLNNLYPEDSSFPTGAGPPRVKDRGCFKGEPAPVESSPLPKVRVNGRMRLLTPRGRRVAFWHCAVIFGTYRPMRVAVVVDGTKVISAMPAIVGSGRVKQAPARTYTG